MGPSPTMLHLRRVTRCRWSCAGCHRWRHETMRTRRCAPRLQRREEDELGRQTREPGCWHGRRSGVERAGGIQTAGEGQTEMATRPLVRQGTGSGVQGEHPAWRALDTRSTDEPHRPCAPGTLRIPEHLPSPLNRHECGTMNPTTSCFTYTSAIASSISRSSVVPGIITLAACRSRAAAKASTTSGASSAQCVRCRGWLQRRDWWQERGNGHG